MQYLQSDGSWRTGTVGILFLGRNTALLLKYGVDDVMLSIVDTPLSWQKAGNFG